jgi:ferric-dicitrate binding protein FerR (iron transport regulator)
VAETAEPVPAEDIVQSGETPAPAKPRRRRRQWSIGHVIALLALVAALVVIGVVVNRVGNTKPPVNSQVTPLAP